jgi:hypothetical protein
MKMKHVCMQTGREGDMPFSCFHCMYFMQTIHKKQKTRIHH